MSLLNKARRAVQRIGIDVNRYDRFTNPALRNAWLIKEHGVDLVLDVGANDGGYGQELRAAGYFGPILSFEPLSSAHAALSIVARGYNDWFVAGRMALGDAKAEATINLAGNSRSSSLLAMLPLHQIAAPGSAYVSTETCPVNRLDEIDHPMLATARRIFLKIDTQGYEAQVFAGASGLLDRLVGVQCEMSFAPLYEGQVLFREIFDTLTSKGFEPWNLVPGFTDHRTGRLLQIDGVFMRTLKA